MRPPPLPQSGQTEQVGAARRRATPVRTLEAVTLVAALEAAVRTGLLDTLDRWSPMTAADLAARAHLAERPVELLLDALAAGGVASCDDRRWTLTAPAAAWSTMHGYAEHIVRFVETGRPDMHTGTARYTAPLHVIGDLAAPLIAGALPAIEPTITRPGARVLELGAGTAPWSRALLTAHPGVSAVAVDHAPVVDQLRARLAADGTTGIDCVSGDVRTVELAAGTGFDVVIVSGLCRLLAGDDNARLFARCAGWLRADGRLLLSDAMSDAVDPDGSLALYALGLAARTAADRLWSSADYASWLAAAGFGPLDVITRDRAGQFVGVARPTA